MGARGYMWLWVGLAALATFFHSRDAVWVVTMLSAQIWVAALVIERRK